MTKKPKPRGTKSEETIAPNNRMEERMSGNGQLGYRVPNLSDVSCPACQQRVNTVPETSAGKVVYLWCATLLVFTGICCCIPFLIEGCKDITQKCSNCGATISSEPATCCLVEE